VSQVEDQDNERKPKQILEKNFRQFGQRYRETVDAPVVLGMTRYVTVAERCQQCFKPFIGFLESVQSQLWSDKKTGLGKVFPFPPAL